MISDIIKLGGNMINNVKRNRFTYKNLERMVRGFSNHRRIQIMELLAKEPDLSLLGISHKLHINFKTACEHCRRLDLTGLVLKRNVDKEVRHCLTDRAINVLTFLRTLE
jgi:predicted transcriptional regulator